MENIKNRDTSIDIVKALGIICVVWGHCEVPFRSFIYLFHMAIFFIASGYCFKSSVADKFESVWKYIWKKIKSLWFPYVLWTAVFSVLHNVFFKLNIYTDDPTIAYYISGEFVSLQDKWSVKNIVVNIVKACLFHGNTQMGGAFWFIAALFELSVAYCIAEFIMRKLFSSERAVVIGQGVVSVILLGAGFVCSLKGISLFQLDRVLSSYCLFYIGVVYRKYNLSAQARKTAVNAIVFVASLVILIVCNSFGAVSLGNNSYVNPLFFIAVSLSGWEFLCILALLIKKSKAMTGMFVYVGQRTLPILVLHFLSFKVVNLIGALVYDMPLCAVAAFPIGYLGIVWWILYTVAGVGIPLGLNAIYESLKRKLVRA